MIATKTLLHVPDLAATQGYIDRVPNVVAAVDVHGARTILIVPMIKEDALVGAFILYRREVRAFADKRSSWSRISPRKP